MTCTRCKSERYVKTGAGRRMCKDCRKSYNGPERQAASDARLAEKIGGGVFQGNSPEHDLTHPVPDGYLMKGASTLYREDGTVAAQWIKSTVDDVRREAMMREAFQAMAAKLPRLPSRKASGTWSTDLLTVYPIGDPHVGMRAWAPETGENWDLTIAEQMHCDAMDALVGAAPATEQALIVNLGDLFHQDGLAAVTPRSGHNLDADGRYAKMIQVGIKVIRRCIESALSKHKSVHVINSPGNHDETGALWLSAALSQMYENEPRVTVDTNPSVFAYYRWGAVLLGVHHGHSCKPDKLPGVMATDRARDWGETTHRHWLMGHIHHESKREFAGVTVESFNTLAAKDAYAAAGGWRSGRSMQALVFHRVHGEVARSKVCADMFAEAA